ncbi:uncharacterized protein PAC_14742 [Phialocephala subalpina]|uniref:Uncharacterized protein n=1 Tax=Phialocephala subalpina TaxID=576137 RepID=A0A1L7XII6_9HELO|nr:uncharacterized protein PAC_14742 [Phialocephala subalpina]
MSAIPEYAGSAMIKVEHKEALLYRPSANHASTQVEPPPYYPSNDHPTTQDNFQMSQSHQEIQQKPRNVSSSKIQSSVVSHIHDIYLKVYSIEGMPFANSLSALTSHHVTRYHINYVSQTITTHIKPATSESNETDTDIIQLESSLPKAKATTPWHQDCIMVALRMFHRGKINSRDLAVEMIESGVTDEILWWMGGELLGDEE